MGSIVSQEGAAREGLLLALVMVSLPFFFFCFWNLTRNMEKPRAGRPIPQVLYCTRISYKKVLHWERFHLPLF